MAIDKTKIDSLLSRDLFKELNLESLSSEERAGMLGEMGKVALEGIWLRVIENLSAEDQVAFEKILEENESAEAMMAFLTAKIPNLEAIVKEEIANFKGILLGV
jgi:hypothetical protein